MSNNNSDSALGRAGKISVRERLARAIERNCGYAKYPLSWNVPLLCDASAERARQCFEVSRGRVNETTHQRISRTWNERSVWQVIGETMADQLRDDDVFRQPSYECAIKHGFAYFAPMPNVYEPQTGQAWYPAGKLGWQRKNQYADLSIEVEFSLEGRSGKHLVIEKFQGQNLRGVSARELALDVRGGFREFTRFTNLECRKLLMMIEVWDQMFSMSEVNREFEYQLGCTYELLFSEESEKSYWAQRDVVTA